MNSFNILRSILLTTFIMLFLTACLSTSAPSDEQAVKLLRDYFSFYDNRGVDAKITKRGGFIKECNCYPIEFQLVDSKNNKDKMTFYFYKNESGSIEIKKYKIDVKTYTNKGPAQS